MIDYWRKNPRRRIGANSLRTKKVESEYEAMCRNIESLAHQRHCIDIKIYIEKGKDHKEGSKIIGYVLENVVNRWLCMRLEIKNRFLMPELKIDFKNPILESGQYRCEFEINRIWQLVKKGDYGENIHPFGFEIYFKLKSSDNKTLYCDGKFTLVGPMSRVIKPNDIQLEFDFD